MPMSAPSEGCIEIKENGGASIFAANVECYSINPADADYNCEVSDASTIKITNLPKSTVHEELFNGNVISVYAMVLDPGAATTFTGKGTIF
mmetsp:Transcript_26536/g.4653  ORF Transcript_26536/g.4653 Transcript_26536/m.4653 type:complete len:91 (+) Transcript_26536:8428-8700(+)